MTKYRLVRMCAGGEKETVTYSPLRERVERMKASLEVEGRRRLTDWNYWIEEEEEEETR